MNNPANTDTSKITKKHSFDDRIVDFKIIHNHKREDFERFIDIIDPQPGQVILDGMDGYGAVAKEILQRTESKGFSPEIYTVDESTVQIDRARQNISHIQPDHIIESDMRQTPFPEGKFDTVVIKMGIHEVPKNDQVIVLREVYRILKKGGKFVTWDLSFHDPETQKVFQDLIRKKDEIAGFDTLIANRYFPRQEELVAAFKEAGFRDISIAHEIDARLSMRVRESELVSKDRKDLQSMKEELTSQDEEGLVRLGRERCDALVTFAKEYMASVPHEIKAKLQYEESGNDIKIVPNKEVIIGYK